MTTEIHLTPIPAAEYRPGRETDEIKLLCRECDLDVQAEGGNLDGWADLLNQAHRQRHQEATP